MTRPLYPAFASACACLAIAASPAWAAEAKRAQPLAGLHTYLTAEDYPAAAIIAGEEGTTAFRLNVDPAGRVTDCAIVASSGSATLDAASCRIMTERARFSPAIDARGKPTADTFESRISWKIPKDAASGQYPVPQAVNAATSLWMSCIHGEAAKLVMSDLALPEVARRAYLTCSTLEQLAAGEMDKAQVPGLTASRAIPGLKENFMQWLRDNLIQTRAVLKGGEQK